MYIMTYNPAQRHSPTHPLTHSPDSHLPGCMLVWVHMADDEQEDEPKPSLPKPAYGGAPFYGSGEAGGSGDSGGSRDSGSDVGNGASGRTFGRVNGKQYHGNNKPQDGSNGSNQLQDGMFKEDPYQSGPPRWGFRGGLGMSSGYSQQPGQILQHPGPVDCLGRPCAPWWKRALAYIVDIFLINIVGSVVVSIVLPGKIQTAKSGLPVLNSHLIEIYVLELVILLGYFALLDGSTRGQTVGKMALGIATRDAATGGQVGAARALVRRLVFVVLFIAFILPGVLNALSPLWSRSWRAWHDSAGNTQVIRVR